MAHRHFTHLEEFIELARTGDIYREETADGFAVQTFRAKSRRSGRDHLRAERLTTDIVARGDTDYAYRTRSRTGTLFGTRDRHGDPAFLATSGHERPVSVVAVTCAQHSQTGFLVHHASVAKTHFSLDRQEVSA